MKNILIVEDDKFLVRVYKVKLEEAGFTVKFVEDGIFVNDVLKTWMPDLIVLDMIMPQKDGFKVIQELKKTKETSNIKILALTQLQMDSDIKIMKDLGAEHYLNKRQATYKDVINKIQSIL